ncbi:hypothetical protein LO749_06385 [Paracoccus denitrificans]|uniref:hypothetical protein n=1 Tax=Paracoccus denitrificans TaxID=266 RepID=UPI001E4CDAF2|nr:hypothetical protein [Paracoccus denitrificans]UFS63814.1 hypothetical protein LO749_06385 [Paracoccus denitrificans]
MNGPVEKARMAWGDAIPDWVLGLARECASSSQNSIAKRMNRSASLISAVLANKYKGSLEAVEEVYRGVFERLTVECPSLGTIPSNTCRDWQLKAVTFVNVNSERVRMYRACNSCPRFKGALK